MRDLFDGGAEYSRHKIVIQRKVREIVSAFPGLNSDPRKIRFSNNVYIMFFLERCGQFCRPGGIRHRLTGAGTRKRPCLHSVLRGMQAVAGDLPGKFKPGEELIERIVVRLLHTAILRRKIDRRFAAELVLDRVQMRIDPVQRAIVQQQLRRRLRADARDARDVIGAVAHQGFKINQMDGVKAVFLTEAGRVIVDRDGLRKLRGDQLDRHMLVDQLQGIPIAGDDHAVPVRPAALLADCADHVVGFPAFAFKDGDAHGAQNILHHRQLHGKLIRHRVTRRLVAVIGQMAERRRLEVERHAQGVGLLLRPELFENIQKTVDRVCKKAVFRRERPHAVVGTVNDAVSIENHQLHGQNSFAFLRLVYHNSRPVARKPPRFIDSFRGKHYTEDRLR